MVRGVCNGGFARAFELCWHRVAVGNALKLINSVFFLNCHLRARFSLLHLFFCFSSSFSSMLIGLACVFFIYLFISLFMVQAADTRHSTFRHSDTQTLGHSDTRTLEILEKLQAAVKLQRCSSPNCKLR